MTDPLSIAAGIIAVLDTTKRVIKYGLDFAGAIKEIRNLKASLEDLETLLERLKDRCQDAPPGAPWLRGLWELRGVKFDKNGVWVQEHRGILAQLNRVIDEMATVLNPSRDWKKTEAYQRSVWHFKKDKINEIHTNITRCCVAINTLLALKNDETLTEALDLTKESSEYAKLQFTDLGNRFSMLEENQRMEQEEKKRKEADIEKKEIVAWLSPLSFIAKQEELFTECFKETGGWLWQDQRFKSWAQGRPWTLKCFGKPGVGKTVLSSLLSHHLPTELQQSPLILSVFLNYKASGAQTLPNLIGSLLKQMIQLDESYSIPSDLTKLYRKAKRLDLTPKSYYNDIRKILVAELDRYERIYLVVDGFDELALRERTTFEGELSKLRPGKLSLVITMRTIEGETSKPGQTVCDRCGRTDIEIFFHCKICDGGNYDVCFDCKEKKGLWCLDDTHQLTEPYGQKEVDVIIPDKDIEEYVRWEIGVEIGNHAEILRDERSAGRDRPGTTPFQDLCQSDPTLPDSIVSTVTEKANGRFLFARLFMDAMKTKTNLRLLKKALQNFPDDINDIHRDSMDRIRLQGKEDRSRAYKILGMIIRARRALSLEELQHGLAVIDFDEEGEDTEADIFDAIDPAKVILDVTSGLVIVENDGSEVRLVHRSLEDYLHREENQKKWFPNADDEIAKACLTYLSLVIPRKPQEDEYFVAKNAKYPFLRYASQYWGDHVRVAESSPDSDGSIQAAALRLINDSQRLDASMQAAWVTNAGGHDTWDVRRHVNKLHVCGWYGLSSVFSALDPEGKSLVDVVEPKYAQTPLMYSCRKGHVGIARQLLEMGASPQKVSARGRTALFEAILSHHDGLVELFGEMKPPDLDINAIHAKEFGRTALLLATRAGHFHMVEKLLRYPGIEINQQDVNGMTALYLAAKYNHEKIVDLLLKSGASIDIVDFKVGRSALRVAAERNFSAIVELLLKPEYHAKPNLKDRHGGTAILHAVNQGAIDALDTMLDYDVDLQCVDEDGQSLLHGASKNGHHSIARRLLEIGLDPDSRDIAERTPLHLASQYGFLPVVSILLDNGADPSLIDEYSRTPKTVAWQYGHTNIASALPTPEPLPSNTNLPIWSLSRLNHTILTNVLTSRPASDILATEPFTQNTALHCAIDSCHPENLLPLLSTRTIPINTPNRVQRTPLMTAALAGDLASTHLLLSHAANPNLKDRWDDETLVLAQSNFHTDIMIALIEAAAVIDTAKIDMETLFFAAVEAGKVEAVRVLLEKGVDRSVQREDGVRAMQIASAGEDEAMMRCLVQAKTVMFVDEGAAQEGGEGEGEGERDMRKRAFVPFRSRPVVL